MSFKRTFYLIALILLLVPLTTLAQQEFVTRVFRLEHISPTSMSTTLSPFPATVQPNDELRTLTVNASAEIMDTIEELIALLDVLEVRPTVELTMHILSANNRAPSGRAMPESLRDVVDQFQSVFTYSNFEVLDSIILRATDGSRATTSGTVSLPPFGQFADAPLFYNLNANFSLISPNSDTRILRLTSLRSGFRVPIATGPLNNQPTPTIQYVDTGINTDVDIPIGQQVVVGKTTVGESAMILVMSARVVE